MGRYFCGQITEVVIVSVQNTLTDDIIERVVAIKYLSMRVLREVMCGARRG